ncbi:MAG TPA: CAP domain-containing protein [Solirubrobacteraceae bacterium]
MAAADHSEWLNEINRYRVAANVSPVTEEPAWVAGLENHLTYLEDTPEEYFTGSYTSLHAENPNSPYYTPSGALEAESSDLLSGGGHTGVEAIDWWWAAPFHAIGMLRAQLSKVALANNPSSGFAGLDVLRGLSRPSSPNPILFPGPGITTNLTRYAGNELPSPLETCGYTGTAPLGLPIIALMPQPPPVGVTATLAGPHGTESSGNGELCVIDASTYTSTDPIYGPAGKQILEFDHAVILIPSHPLTDGVYEVAIYQPEDSDVAWSFTAQVAPPRNIISPTIIGAPVEHSVLFANPGSWANEPTSYSYRWLRCDTSGSGCVPIADVTSDAYEVAAPDVGSTLRLEVAATNSGGSTFVITPATAVVSTSIDSGTGAVFTTAYPTYTLDDGSSGARSKSSGGNTGMASFSLRLQLSRGRATIKVPALASGQRFRMRTTLQQRKCRHLGVACQWHTITRSDRVLRLHSPSTHETLPVPRGDERVTVNILIFPFSRNGIRYHASERSGIEP